jgi:hypothetical protein
MGFLTQAISPRGRDLDPVDAVSTHERNRVDARINARVGKPKLRKNMRFPSPKSGFGKVGLDLFPLCQCE